ncbi:MAG: hypothetical protein A2Z99_02305 [Treponema sp. GWB1_62_6]|nr:MAG: hypothetical protein A2001_03975 [Treponema sp. GWC1_61_84]OHE69700.1 MAG: hypothetical protein A2Z99_02305 [Treponema sp. GWB1_62_6]
MNLFAAEYADARDLLVIVSTAPNRLTVIDPASGINAYCALPAAPSALALTPDGNSAAVAHAGSVSIVSLSAATPALERNIALVSDTYSGSDASSIAYGPDGYVYFFPTENQWVDLRRIEAATGVQAFFDINDGLYENVLARLAPSGNSIYWIDRNSSPRDLHWINLDAVDMTAYGSSLDSSYHGDYPIGTAGIWFDHEGYRILTSAGTIFSSTESGSNATDMRYLGTLAPALGNMAVRWASQTDYGLFSGSSSPLFAAIPYDPSAYTTDLSPRRIVLVSSDDFSQKGSYDLPLFVDGAGTATRAQGAFCFWRSDGSELYVVARSAEAAMTGDFDLIVY